MERLKAKTKKFRGVFMSKIINLSVNGKTIDELSREYQKMFYKKAALIENKGRVFLQSYDTIVACVDKGKLLKLWDGYSTTTARHIDAFCYSFGVKPVSKKDWENMPLSRIKKPYREDLNYKANYFNPYSDRCYFA